MTPAAEAVAQAVIAASQPLMPPAPEPLIWMTEPALCAVIALVALAGAVIGYVVGQLHANSGNRD